MIQPARLPHFFSRLQLLLVFLITTGLCLSLEGRGITGIQSASYRLHPEISVPEYENQGYVFRSLPGGTFQVQVDASPFRNSTPYPTPINNLEAKTLLIRNADHYSIQIPKLLATRIAEQRGYVDVVTEILDWVAGHFTYGKTDGTPYRGDCNTLTDTTISLLTAFEIPARPAVGIVMETDSRVLAGPALHRFVEIYYPPAGWMFSDPLASHHFVPASYVFIPEKMADLYLGTKITRISTLPELKPVAILNYSAIPKRINLFRFK